MALIIIEAFPISTSRLLWSTMRRVSHFCHANVIYFWGSLLRCCKWCRKHRFRTWISWNSRNVCLSLQLASPTEVQTILLNLSLWLPSKLLGHDKTEKSWGCWSQAWESKTRMWQVSTTPEFSTTFASHNFNLTTENQLDQGANLQSVSRSDLCHCSIEPQHCDSSGSWSCRDSFWGFYAFCLAEVIFIIFIPNAWKILFLI